LDWKLAYGNGVFVAAGKKNDTSGSAWYSDDGLAWQRSNSGAAHENLAFGAGRFASWAGRLPLSTVDGREWAWHEPLDVPVSGELIFGRSRLLGLTPDPNEPDDHPVKWLLESSDGMHWQTRLIPPLDLPDDVQHYTYEVKSAVYAKGRMVFVDERKVISSADGEHWDVGKWYWPGPSWASQSLHVVMYGKGQFVAGGHDTQSSPKVDLLLSSEDGVTWTSHWPEGAVPEKWIYANGAFLAASQKSSSGGTIFYGSVDGLTWTNLVEVETTAAPSDLLFGEGRFHLVTRGGEVWRSGLMPPYVTEPRVIPELTYRLPDGAMLVTVEAPYGQQVVVEGSEDLETWQEVGRDPCDRGEFEVYHETAPPGTDWFYRARQVSE
ncbi:MAG: hypothetical protein H7A46_21690, partial [Verrucomicrobiales bacterium]|nr:hypothetical protein [Verrucomicrobiales bacterium]